MKKIVGAHKQVGPRTRHRPPSKATERLLILEPEGLVRWSLATYMAKWFDVSTAESADDATAILGRLRVNAVVISDDLSRGSAEDVVARAREENPHVRVVRIVANPNGQRGAFQDAPTVEKPFDLAKLAALLLPRRRGLHRA